MPGHKLEWILKAPKYGSDALMLDLEDSVAADEKVSARKTVGKAIQELAPSGIGIFVRVNPWETELLLGDVADVLLPGLSGIVLSKVEGPNDVVALDYVMSEIERARGITIGSVEIVPICETARGIFLHFDICMSSTRIRRSGAVGIVAPGADITRSLGLHMESPLGTEGLYINVRSGLEARAAGITNIVGGLTTKLDDLDLARQIITQARDLGATEGTAIHPSHVPILNEVYSPSPQEITEAQEVLDLMYRAESGGDAAVRYKGIMVDHAHIKTYESLLERARSFGLLPDA
jgi:citrate lyase subunit beta/citryl-CoA lyase